MTTPLTRRAALAGAGALVAAATGPALADSAAEIDARCNLALGRMYGKFPDTVDLAARSRAILIMPEVLEGGLIVSGAYGEGALRLNEGGRFERTAEYYSFASASIGLLAGVQSSTHALFFLTDEALARFRRQDGWEIGVDAEVTFPDAGLIAELNTTSAPSPVVGVVFDQDGFLAGIGLEGGKYSRIVR